MTELKSRYNKEEEMANALSHFAGALLAIAALVFLIIKAARIGNAWHIVSSAIFGATMIFLFFSSTMTHWLKPGKAKDVFFTIDQIAIFALIDGTFGWVIFGIEWGLAIIGITIKLVRPTQFNAGVNLFYIILYAAMGWMLLIAIVPIFKNIPTMGVIWILIGGICYTVGIFFYRKARFKHHHLVWHLLVVAGAASHFISIYYYLLPITV
jgi:hemolysin III